MPIFEYQCNTCKNRFEVLQRTNEDKNVYKCPECGTTDTSKRLSTFAAVGTQKDATTDNAT